MSSLSPKQLRILTFLRGRGGWATRREMESWAGRKGFSKALGAPTREIEPGTLEGLGYVKRRDMAPPFEYQLTELGERALSSYERTHGPIVPLTYRTEEAMKDYEQWRHRLHACQDVGVGKNGATREGAGHLSQQYLELSESAQQAVVAMASAFVADWRALLSLRLEGEGDIAAADDERPDQDLSDNEAQRFLSCGMRAVELCLKGLSESLTVGDARAARLQCEQALRLIGAMRELQEAWPWTDMKAVEQSWKQYQHGELMDFETFKHELLKTAE